MTAKHLALVLCAMSDFGMTPDQALNFVQNFPREAEYRLKVLQKVVNHIKTTTNELSGEETADRL